MSKKKKKKKSKKTIPLTRRLLRHAVALGLFGFSFGMLLVAWCAWGLPSLDDVKPLDLKPSITVLAADGSPVARYGGLKGEAARLKTLPLHVKNAVIAVEDRRFTRHPGLDVLGLARAMLANVKARAWVQGGSTLTQQLAKNLFLVPDKTLRRKGQEALMALLLERRFTKDEILEAYLNRVYFGSGAYGIDAAARAYFGKPPQQLTLWESAILAGLLKAPSRYSPFSDPARARDRAHTVLRLMHEAGYITEAQMKEGMQNKKIHLVTAPTGEVGRYFADWILSQLDNFMIDTPGDITVYTTFSPELQRLAEEKAATAALPPAKEGEKPPQLALVTLAQDGAVLAMVGGRDYSVSQFNRATQAKRQPGSAFKPFVYLAALEAGFEPSTRILDAPFKSGDYRPQNYDGEYHGDVPLVDALALSLNTATVRLLQDVGLSRLLDVAKRAGFGKTVAPNLASALGANETTLLTLSSSYAIIANGGRGVWPYAVLRIEDNNGNILYNRGGLEYAQVFGPRDIAKLDNMLGMVVGWGTGRGASLPNARAAGKTGTSQDHRDAWFVGYAGPLVTGVWMGNDDASPMKHVSGGGAPARLWRDYMAAALTVAPAYAPAAPRAAAPQRGGDSFFDRISRWSSGDFGGDRNSDSGGRFKGDNTPVYNP